MSTTLVVDGTNIAMRAIKAAEGHGTKLSAVVDGVEVNTAGLFMFIQTLARHVKEVRPDRMIVCWDGGRSEHRVAIYPEYKENRLHRLEEESGTFHRMKEFLTLNGIHHVEIQGVEADDLVAAYSRVRSSEDDEVVILSGDKDFLQLLTPKVSQIRPGVKPERWGVAEVKEKLDCFPEDIPFVMALTGDVTDGIPSIPGIGHKTAVKLLVKYNWSLPRLLEGGEPKLIGQERDVWRNYHLVSLAPIAEGLYEGGYIPAFDNDPVRLGTYQELVEWLRRYDMGSLQSRLDAGVLWREPGED